MGTGHAEPFVQATVVWRRAPSSGRQGGKAVIGADGSVSGWVGGACAEPLVVAEALAALGDGKPRLMALGPDEELRDEHREGVVRAPISCQSEGAMEVYLEPVLPPPQLVVIGRSPAVEALASIAGVLSWEVAVIGDQAELGSLAGHVTERSLTVVATQGHYDEAALEAVLTLRPAYVGLVASHKRAQSVLEYLRERGTPDDALARVRAPAGIDLGSVANEEIAVAIVAEIVALRAAGEIGGGVKVAPAAGAQAEGASPSRCCAPS